MTQKVVTIPDDDKETGICIQAMCLDSFYGGYNYENVSLVSCRL